MAIIHRSGQEVFIAKENNFLKEAPNLLDVASQTTLIEAMEEDKLLEDFVDLNAAEEVNSTAHSPHTPPQITNLSHRSYNKAQQHQEGSARNNTIPIVLPEVPLFFQAVGLVRGQYLPSAETKEKGILLLDDGVMAPTNLLASAAYTLDKNSQLLDSPQVWIVYPRVKLQPPFLHFAIRGVRNPLQGEDSDIINQSVDDFTIRGIVSQENSKAGKFVVKVYRNFMPWNEQEGIKYKPYIFPINGVLPSKSPTYGQFWNLKVRRSFDQLVFVDGTFVAQVLAPKKPKKGHAKRQRQKGKEKHNQ